MRTLSFLGPAGLFLLAAMTGCSSASSTTQLPPGNTTAIAQSSLARDPASAIAPASQAAAVTANNAFALDLYTRLRASSATSNLLASPISASLALTMTYAGANGETRSQMATALHFADATSTIFDGQNALSQALDARAAAALAAAGRNADPGSTAPSPSDYQLQVVNSVWGDKSYTWAEPFLDTLAKSYGTGVREENFIGDSSDALVAINTWVANATADKIQNLLTSDAVNATTRLVLVNAIHLKLPWAIPFDATQTRAQTFAREDGTTVTAPLMVQTLEDVRYVDDGQAQVVELPLEGNELAVEIALPHGDLAAYEAGLTGASAPIARPSASNASVTLSLPKMTFTTDTFTLVDALEGMGMTDAFDATRADFSGLSPTSKLYVGTVQQKAMIAMAETGVEAAAATAVGVLSGSAPVNPVVMTVNKPYLLSIIDTTSGAVLFLGHITDPTNPGGQ